MGSTFFTLPLKSNMPSRSVFFFFFSVGGPKIKIDGYIAKQKLESEDNLRYFVFLFFFLRKLLMGTQQYCQDEAILMNITTNDLVQLAISRYVVLW